MVLPSMFSRCWGQGGIGICRVPHGTLRQPPRHGHTRSHCDTRHSAYGWCTKGGSAVAHIGRQWVLDRAALAHPVGESDLSQPPWRFTRKNNFAPKAPKENFDLKKDTPRNTRRGGGWGGADPLPPGPTVLGRLVLQFPCTPCLWSRWGAPRGGGCWSHCSFRAILRHGG